MNSGQQASTPTSIGVIGGGIAGMSFAIRAAALGIGVTIIEIDPNWRVYGAGISITGPTYRALKRLGLLDSVKREGFFVTGGATICNAQGLPVAELPLHRLEPDLPTAGGILRPVLHSILADRVRSLGIEVVLGESVAALSSDADGVDLTLTSGARRRFDLVAGADGVGSALRGLLLPGTPAPSYTGQYCWRLLAERPADIDRPFFFIGEATTAGLMPVSESSMYLWLLETVPERQRVSQADLADRLTALVAPFGATMEPVRQAIAAGAEIIVRPLDALLVPLPWHQGRTILIGDAIHATTPHLASGAGIAIEDAIVLADLLATTPSPQEAFAAFEARRWDRCRLVVESSVEIGAMQQAGIDPQRLNERMRTAQAMLAQDI